MFFKLSIFRSYIVIAVIPVTGAVIDVFIEHRSAKAAGKGIYDIEFFATFSIKTSSGIYFNLADVWVMPAFPDLPLFSFQRFKVL